jgi:hypothetical protein
MSLMYMQMGMKAVGAFSTFSAASHQSKMERISRDYQEKMSAISAAMQLNVQTQNEIDSRDALVRAGVALEITAMQDRAEAEVSAAAAGAAGGSVTGVMRGLMRSRLQAKQALRHQKFQQARANTQTRRNIEFAKVMGKDISPIGKPSAASALLGLGASMIDIYDSHQPDGQRTADKMAEWFRK